MDDVRGPKLLKECGQSHHVVDTTGAYITRWKLPGFGFRRANAEHVLAPQLMG
jgi:hypothetical protein